MNKIIRILFVCTGNSCRSIMAEGLMKSVLKGLGKVGIDVSSAGVSAIDGFRPTHETIEVMKREGVDVSEDDLKELELLVKTHERLYPKEAVNHRMVVEGLNFSF